MIGRRQFLGRAALALVGALLPQAQEDEIERLRQLVDLQERQIENLRETCAFNLNSARRLAGAYVLEVMRRQRCESAHRLRWVE